MILNEKTDAWFSDWKTQVCFKHLEGVNLLPNSEGVFMRFSIPADVCYRCAKYWRRKQLPAPGFLSGKSHGQRSLKGHSPWGRKESDTTNTHMWNFGWIEIMASPNDWLWNLKQAIELSFFIYGIDISALVYSLWTIMGLKWDNVYCTENTTQKVIDKCWLSLSHMW